MTYQIITAEIHNHSNCFVFNDSSMTIQHGLFHLTCSHASLITDVILKAKSFVLTFTDNNNMLHACASHS